MPAQPVARPDARRIDRWSLAAAACAILVVALTYWRVFYGVDFTDEAYYAAVPYRFVLGARPFVDETTTAQQPAALLMYPFIAAYNAVVGVGGIVLFARHLHLLFSCAVAACVYGGLRPFVRRTEAMLASLTPVAFVPFSLPDLSYNTLGSGFFVAGCFLGLRFLATERPRVLATAGLAHGLAIVVYPTFIVPVVVYVAVLSVVSPVRPRRLLLRYAVPAIVPIAALVALFIHTGIDEVHALYTQAREFGGQGGGLGKAVSIIPGLTGIVLHAPLGILCIAVVLALRRRTPRLVPWLLVVTPLLLVPLGDVSGSYGAVNYVTIYGVFGLVLWPFVRSTPDMNVLFLAIWPAAFVGGLSTAWTSNNGADAFGLGFAPAPIVTTALLAFVCRRQFAVLGRTTRGSASAFMAATSSLLVLTALQFTWVYRDGDFLSLDKQVRNGPYAGIFTTAGKRRFIETMSTDLRRLAPAKCRILFYDHFPAGYLMSASRPYTNAVFLLFVPSAKIRAYRRVLFRYYDSKGGSLPDVVVRMSEIPGLEGSQRVAYSPIDPLDRLVRRSRTYRLAATRPQYAIYHLRSDRCLTSK